MVETLSTFLTMHVYSWNWIFYLNYNYMMLLNKMCCVDENELSWDPGWLGCDFELWDVRY